MRYFYDTEFHEDGTIIDLISLGMVCEDGRELYFECQFDQDRVEGLEDPFLRERVLPHLLWDKKDRYSKEQARDVVLGFVGLDKNPEFWAYFADYDHVALAQLFGRMIDLPKHFPMYTLDVKQLAVTLGSPSYAKPPKPKNCHHALADAKWNFEYFRNLESILKKER